MTTNFHQWFFQLVCSIFVACFYTVYAERGIVVAVNDRYLDAFFLGSLDHLRNHLQCSLPIEIWFIGDELSEASKEKTAKYPPVTFCNLYDYIDEDPEPYKGWQIKAWLPKLTAFHEVILMDADVFFYQNPEILFSHPLYMQTKCYLFQDSQWFQFPIRPLLGHFWKISDNIQLYMERRQWIRSLIPHYSPYVPSTLRFYWEDVVPSVDNPFPSEHIDSGCVAIDIESHKKSIENILQLNKDREYVYKYVHGDKETFWLGCEMAQEPYTINATPSYGLVKRYGRYDKLHQFLDDRLFYQQKHPNLVDRGAYFAPHASTGVCYRISEDEKVSMNAAYDSWQRALQQTSSPR